MDQAYWDSLAERFGEDVLQIAHHDPGGSLQAEIARLASKDRTAADLGCGPGSLIPRLSQSFKRVIAVDYSRRLLDAAERLHTRPNVRFARHDLGSGKPLPFAVDVTLCVNAMIAPSRLQRERMAAAVHAATARKGTALVVVPALESVFHVYHTLIRCRRRDGAPSGLGPRQADRLLRSEMQSFADGIIRVSGVPTKYWMREELAVALQDSGFTLERIRKVEYAWEEELDDPPAWLAEPRPWDWLVVARR